MPAAPCPWVCVRREKRRARRRTLWRRLWGRLFSRHPRRRAQRLLPRLSTASGASPRTQLIASERPLSTIPAANVPHFPLIHLSTASCSEAAAQRIHRIHRSPPAAAGSRCSSRTHRHRARGRAPTRHLRFARENHSSACKSQAARGDRLCDQAGMEEETPPPQMPYLFAALASRVLGRGGSSPVLLLPDPELGGHRSSLSPLF